MSFAATLMMQPAGPSQASGLPRKDDPQRLLKVCKIALAFESLTPERVARLGRSEPLEAAARAYSEGIERSPFVEGWTRQVSADGCEICSSSRRSSPASLNADVPPHGCTCIPVPMIKEK